MVIKPQSAALDDAEDVGIFEELPLYQADRATRLGPLDVGHLRNEQHRARRQLFAEFPAATGMARFVEIAQETLACLAGIKVGADPAAGDGRRIVDRGRDKRARITYPVLSV